MTTSISSTMLFLMPLASPEGEEGRPDPALLADFVRTKDEAAFKALVQRHYPRVWSICYRKMRDPNHAADIFQATFLILVRKADSIVLEESQSLGPWLCKVALNLAIEQLRKTSRERKHQREAGEQCPKTGRRRKRETEEGEQEDVQEDEHESEPILDEPASTLYGEVDRSILYEEIDRLPEMHREPLICTLKGLTNKQIAKKLKQPVGTINSRLSRGRDKLRKRLVRRGVAPAVAVGVLASLPALAAVPPTLLRETVQSAMRLANGGAIVSPSVASLVNQQPKKTLLSSLWEGRYLYFLGWLCGFLLLGVAAPTEAGNGGLKRRAVHVPVVAGSTEWTQSGQLTRINGHPWRYICFKRNGHAPADRNLEDISRKTMVAEVLAVGPRSVTFDVPELGATVEILKLDGLLRGKPDQENRALLYFDVNSSGEMNRFFIAWPVDDEPPDPSSGPSA